MTTPSTPASSGLSRGAFLRAAAVTALAPTILARPAEALAHGGRHGHRFAGDWRLPAHDLEGTRAADRGPGGLAIRWRQPVEGGLTGAPLILDGLAVAASLGAEVAAFDLEDGSERWRRPFEPAVYGSGDGQVSLGFFGGAAACGHRVVMASDRVRCLDLRDGTTLWEAEPLRGPSDDDYFWGPPVIAAGLVLLGSGAGSEATVTRGRVSAYDLHDGSLRWSTPLVPEGANGGGVLAPVTVDLSTGSVWAATGAPYVPPPQPVPGASALVELSLRSGRVRWQDDVHPGDTLGLDLNSAPVLSGSTIGVTGKDGVWAWDRRTRARRWHVQLTPATPSGGGTAGPTNGPEGGPIAADGDRFLVLSNDEDRAVSVAASLDRKRGRVRWQADLGGLTFAAPAVAGERLFAATASGFLEVLRTRDGSSVARVPLGVPSAGAVAIGERRVLVGVGAEPFLPGGELVCVG